MKIEIYEIPSGTQPSGCRKYNHLVIVIMQWAQPLNSEGISDRSDYASKREIGLSEDAAG